MTYPGDDKNDLENDLGESAENSWAEEEQLVLADEDEDLPWLEADEYEEEGSFDWRIVTYALLGLAVVGAVLGALWFGLRDRADPELVADGSTIEAPEGAYKQRPDDPGGAEVAGTGDQAFEVAEGESTRGRIADGGETSSDAGPAIDRDQGSSSESGSAESAAPASSGSSVYVQIGAFGSEADAQTAWNSAAGRYSALSGMRHRVVEADVNGAKVYRLQAIAGDRAGADATCRAIRNAGGDCYIR